MGVNISFAAVKLSAYINDGVSDGPVFRADIAATVSPTLWGIPVVTTQSMQVDKVLVGSFDMGAYIFDQWKSRVEVGFQNDDFTRNKVTIFAEQRLALAVYRPESFIYGDFGRVS